MSNPTPPFRVVQINYLGNPVTLPDDGTRERFARALDEVPTDAELADRERKAKAKKRGSRV